MVHVIVVRSFVEPVDFPALADRESEGGWCLEQYRVKAVRSFLAHDGLRTLCVYTAPDLEAVRVAQRTLDMPLDEMWAAQVIQSEPADELYCVERTFEEPITPSIVDELGDKAAWCHELYGAERRHSYLSQDGRRGLCAFQAPDAEAVRSATRKAELPFDRVWGAKLIEL